MYTLGYRVTAVTKILKSSGINKIEIYSLLPGPCWWGELVSCAHFRRYTHICLFPLCSSPHLPCCSSSSALPKLSSCCIRKPLGKGKERKFWQFFFSCKWGWSWIHHFNCSLLSRNWFAMSSYKIDGEMESVSGWSFVQLKFYCGKNKKQILEETCSLSQYTSVFKIFCFTYITVVTYIVLNIRWMIQSLWITIFLFLSPFAL